MNCIFCEIVNKKIPSLPIYEDENWIVVLDINPCSKGHCLIISKEHDKIKGKLDHIIQKLIEKKEILGFKTFVLLKKAEIEHFVLNFIPIYEGNEVLYQVNNKPGEQKELEKLMEKMKIVIDNKKEKKIIEIKNKEIKEKEKKEEKGNIWYVHP